MEQDNIEQKIEHQICSIKESMPFPCGECGHLILVEESYRCFYCGLWYCHSCASEHFKLALSENTRNEMFNLVSQGIIWKASALTTTERLIDLIEENVDRNKDK